MITELTAEQTALMPIIQQRWLKIGLSTEQTTDRDLVARTLARVYEVAKLPAPTTILWEPSPYHGAIAAARLGNPKLTGAALRTEAQRQIHSAGYGNQDASWLAFYDFFREACHIKECDLLIPLSDLARLIGWWWPFDDACIVTPKPSALHRDAQNRLHCEDGPALDYTGTWGIYAWHGSRVPKQVIMEPDTLTANDVLTHPNAEVSRIMLERMSLETFLWQAKPKILDQDIDGAQQPRTLYQIDTPNDPEAAIVVCYVRCPSTGHTSLLRVPPTIGKCHDAIAWTENVPPWAYAPLVET